MGRGDIDVSLERWVPFNLPMMNDIVKVHSLFINEREVNTTLTTSLLGSSICEDIIKENINLTHSEDKVCWTKNSASNFTLKSAWDIIRERGPKSFTFKRLWYPNRPLKVSVFLWRVLKNAIPVDSLIMSKGIYIPSKCSCCSNCPNTESIDNLFFNGEVAHTVWTFFEK